MEEYEKQEIEKLEEEKFNEVTSKQLKYTKKVFKLVFGILGGVFFILGLIMIAVRDGDPDTKIAGIVFTSLGLFFMLIGFIVSAAICVKPDYKKAKIYIEKYGGLNTYSYYAVTAVMQTKIEVLEKRVGDLEEELNYLKNNR